MKIRPLEFAELAKKYALGSLLAASSFTLGVPAMAQDSAEALTPSTEDSTGALASPPESPAADQAKETAPDKAKEEAKGGKGAAKVRADAAAQPNAAAEAEAAAVPVPVPASVGLERLPPAAYPTDPIPGIPGGSLSLVLDRLQWPYMPKYPGAPRLRVGISGVGWLDSSYRQIKAGLSTEDNQTEYRMQGRFTLRVTPVYNLPRNWFVQTNAEFIAAADQDNTVTGYTTVDDFWVRVGMWKVFDVQVGRMQGFEVYHYGMGLDLNTFERKGAVSFSKSPVQPYGLSDLWDRGLSNGAIALHWYLPKWLRLELLARFGLSGQGNDIGLRPVGVLDLGWMKLKGGYERHLQSSLFNHSKARAQSEGLGGELQFVIAPWIEFGGGAAQRVLDTFTQEGAPRPGDCTTTTTYGGFLNVRPYFKDWLVGVGYHYTNWFDFNFDAFGKRERSNHTQMFGAVQYLLWNTLYIKYVLSYAQGHIRERDDIDPTNTGFDNKSLNHRLRLMMFF